MWGLSNPVCLQGGAAVRTLYSRTSHFSHLVKKLRFILRLFEFNRVSNWTLDKTPHQITQQLDNSVDGVRNYCPTLWMVGKATPVQISCVLEEAQSLVVSCASDEMRGCCAASKIKMATNDWRSEVRVRNVTQCVAHCACATFWLLNIVGAAVFKLFFIKNLHILLRSPFQPALYERGVDCNCLIVWRRGCCPRVARDHWGNVLGHVVV